MSMHSSKAEGEKGDMSVSRQQSTDWPFVKRENFGEHREMMMTMDSKRGRDDRLW